MAASKTHKALLISQMLDQLKSTFPDVAELPRLELVESVIFAILRENRNSSEALHSLARFKSDYEDDYNELRVSGLREILRKMGPSPDAEARARSIRKFLHQIFDSNYKFQIDGLAKKPFKEARDDLKDYEVLANDHHMAYVQVQCLGGHAFPVDARILETARRLGVVDASADVSTLRGLLEKNIPKAQILQAIGLVERFVNEVCLADSPRCKTCPFQKICPFHLGLNSVAKSAKDVETPVSPKPKSPKTAAVAATEPPKNMKPAASVPKSASTSEGKPAKEKSVAGKDATSSAKVDVVKPSEKHASASPAPVKSSSAEISSSSSAKAAAKPQVSKSANATPIAESKSSQSSKPAAKPPVKTAEKPDKKSASSRSATPAPEPVSKPAAPKPASKQAKPVPKKGKKS